VQLTTAFDVSWSGTDGASGATAFDVRYRRAGPSGAFGAHVVWLTATTGTSASFSGIAGSTYCFSARAFDGAGNVSEWSTEHCTALPLDNTQLSHSGAWTKKRAGGHYLGTYSVSSRRGASLTRTRVGAVRLAVVVTRCPTCGVLGVYWKGKLVKKAGLRAAVTQKKQLVQVPLFPAFAKGTVELRVLSSGKPVMVDALAVSPR
jgi:hypothetical protein